CHVMDRESYEDETLAPLINQRFVAVKVDRDERPDVDSRYQAAVQAVSGQGGWPLTAVLTPDGRPFFGGTYFPRHDRYGRPGIERLLLTMSDAWHAKRDEVLESANSILAAIEHGEAFAGRSGSLSSAISDKLVHSAIAQFDPHHGGFGAQPKFPHPAALDLLLDAATRKGDAKAREVALVTLTKMANGGIYDHVGGGFHRYSVDERWVVPHFEKMLYDNAGLVTNYVHAWQSFPYPVFSTVVRETVAWMDAWLSDRQNGGFYGSQDADMTLDDDGDYFTWTRAEAAEVLSPDELELTGTYYDIGELGDMHHNPAKNVLHIQRPLDSLANDLKREPAELTRLLTSARAKLAAARTMRPTPYVDRTVYTGWNAMAISAYLQASAVLPVAGAREFAIKTLNRILSKAWSEQDGLAHVVAYAAGEHGQRVPGVLDDYALLVHACLDAWELTLEMRYYDAAMKLAQRMQRDFYDATGGGFFDTAADPNAIGALSTRRKPLQDTPTPAGNPTAACALLRLEELNGDAKLRELAEDTLEAFAGIVEHFGLFAGSYGLALERLLNAPQQIVIVGEDDLAAAMESAARSGYAVNKTVLRASPAVLRDGALPPVLKATLTQLPQLQEQATFAVVCRGTTCLPPVRTVEELLSSTATRP
ncbi:MAG TPA: thioredoxin domain-containing protein, partial [Acidobacteriaceae bacterium]